jgi:hypothetical protein
VRPLIHSALPDVTFESWKNAVGRIIREEVRRGMLSSVTDFVTDEAVKLLKNTDSEREENDPQCVMSQTSHGWYMAFKFA